MERQPLAHTDNSENSSIVNDIQKRRHTRSESDHPALVTYQGNRLPECRILNFSLGGLFLECQGCNLEEIISNGDLVQGRRNQAAIEIQRLDNGGNADFSLIVRLARVSASGLGVAFLTPQNALLDYLKTREQTGFQGDTPTRAPSDLSTVSDSRDSARIIQELQNISRRYLTGKLSRFFLGIDEELIAARDYTNTRVFDGQLSHGLETIATNESAISDSFMVQIDSDLTLQGLAARGQKLFYAQSDSQNMELVNKEDFEEWVVIVGIARADEGIYAYNLQKLEKALSRLASCPVNNETNPLSPSSFLWLLNDTLEKLGLEIEPKKTAFRIIKDTLLVSINELYKELLDYLEKQGISENRTKTRPTNRTPGGHREERQQQDRDSSVYEEPMQPGNSITGDHIERYGHSEQNVRKTSLETLSTLIYDNGADWCTHEAGTSASEEEIILALQSIPRDSATPLVSRIEEQLTSMGHQGDSATINPKIRKTISAAEQLIGEIQNDQIINNDLRNLVRGLETSLLRESIEDSSLLSNTDHPVRKLLNSIDRLAPYFTQDQNGSSIIKTATEQLRSIVEDTSKNAGNVDIRGLTAKVDSLLDQQQQNFRSNLAVVKDSTEENERLRATRKRIEAFLSEKLKDKSVSVVLADLLRLGWAEVLVQSAELESEISEACEGVIDYLILMFDPQQHLGVVSRDSVSKLCQVVKQNFSLYPLYPKETEALTEKIRIALYEKGETYQTLLSDRVTIDEDFLKSLFDNDIPTDEDPEDIRLNDASWMDRVKAIKVDDWIADHFGQGQVRLLNLAWKTPESSRFVFVDGGGQRVLDSSLASLASQFEMNRYSLLENRDLPLVERAVQKALKDTFEKIRKDSDTDELTGLMNRKSFEREIARVMEISSRKNTQHILIMVDIDQFSMVNDVCGLEGGDRLLQDVTTILSTYVSPSTILGRTGDDEFGILLEDGNLDAGFQLAESLRRRVDVYKFSWESQTVPVTTSAGLVRIDSNTNNPGELLKDAFSACRTAKEAGKNCSRLHQPSSLEFAQRQRMIKSVPMIEQAMERNLIELHAQLITPLSIGEDSDHHEILLRVQNEAGDLEGPAEFIQAAEQFDRMRSIDRWVVNAFFSWLEKNRETVRNMGGFAVNLSGQSLLDNRFAAFLKDKISHSQISPEKIGFEVTETALVRSTGQANKFIQSIREMGCSFYLDDFGSGYASYSHLKDMPVDIIKIDGVFVSDMLEQKSSYTMVKSVTEIAHFMNKKVIAEFVESEAILNALRKLNVDFAQGYAVGRPIPLDQVLPNSASLK